MKNQMMDKEKETIEEKRRDWYLTWGFNQGHDNCYTIIRGTYDSARERMNQEWGPYWCGQYESAEKAGVSEFNLHEVK